MQRSILSYDEIMTFKRYIDRKFGDPRLRTAILADALLRVIDRRLPPLPDEERRRFGAALLQRGAQLPTIDADLVLQAGLRLDLQREELLRPLAAWCCERLELEAASETAVAAVLLRWHREPASYDGMRGLRREAEQEAAVAETSAAAVPAGGIARPAPRRRMNIAAAAGLLLLAGALGIFSAFEAVSVSDASADLPAADDSPPSGAPAEEAPPPEGGDGGYRYAAVDTERLRAYLRQRGSALAEEPYLSAIVGAAERHDVHPLLLFAITGQEQSLVPSTHEHAERIASNPFNVYGSWETYNTDIDDSAGLAAKLVAKRLADRPEDADAIQWINRTYAEDPNWWKGVSWFFEDMQKKIEQGSR